MTIRLSLRDNNLLISHESIATEIMCKLSLYQYISQPIRTQVKLKGLPMMLTG